MRDLNPPPEGPRQVVTDFENQILASVNHFAQNTDITFAELVGVLAITTHKIGQGTVIIEE